MSSLIELGYDGKGMVVMIMNGFLGEKPFKSVANLSVPQALKLADDLKMTVLRMTQEKEKA